MMLGAQEDAIQGIPPEPGIGIPAVDVMGIEETRLSGRIHITVGPSAYRTLVSMKDADFVHPETHKPVADGGLLLQPLPLRLSYPSGRHANLLVFLLDLGLEVFHGLADRIELFRVILGDGKAELLLHRHQDLHAVQRIRAEVILE